MLNNNEYFCWLLKIDSKRQQQSEKRETQEAHTSTRSLISFNLCESKRIFCFLRLARKLLPSQVVVDTCSRRNLTLITKVVQNISNGVDFGTKEAYMIPMS